MQWLIDIAIAAMKSWIYENGIFRYRGVYMGSDWNLGNFTFDNVWRDLDCSAIVPEHAKLILFRFLVTSNAISDRIRFRRKGDTHSIQTCLVRPQVAAVLHSAQINVACDDNRVIQYAANPGDWTAFNLVVQGWWL